MRTIKHIAPGMIPFIFLVCLVSMVAGAEGNDVALFKYRNSVHFREVARALLALQGRHKRGFDNTDTGNRATETTSTIRTTHSAPPINPDMDSSTKTSGTKTLQVTTTTTAKTTTAVVLSSSSSTTTTTGDKSTVSTEHTTNAGNVISMKYTYISLLILTVAYILL